VHPADPLAHHLAEHRHGEDRERFGRDHINGDTIFRLCNTYLYRHPPHPYDHPAKRDAAMSAQFAVNVMWAVWYSTWLAAVVFSARTTAQMQTDVNGAYRMLIGIGAVLLFVPAVPVAAVAAAFAPLWPEPLQMQWVLFALTAAGFLFCWWARLHLGRLWSGFVTLKEGHYIVDTGPYGLVRHPIYSGVIFSAFATAAMRPTLAAFLGAALIGVGFAITARVEERFLREQLGAGAYDAYKSRVPMLVPGLR
jgi:protein-S-isoprenylcysteine O-methyltransferase Ste14